MSKADDVHYELLQLALEVYRQNVALGGAVASRTAETALHAVNTARKAATISKDKELARLCDEAEQQIAPLPAEPGLPVARASAARTTP